MSIISSPSPPTPGSPRPGLSPASPSDDSCEGNAIPARKTGTETIEEAFGGKLWPGKSQRRWPGVSAYQVALKRLSRPVPVGSKPSDSLIHWGFRRHKSTRALFYLTDNFHGRIIPINLATKWILSVCGNTRKYAKKATGEDLNQTNRTGEFRGVTLQFVPFENTRCESIAENELEFCQCTVQAIEGWLASRPVPEGHTRFFHGTSTHAMNSIVEHGIKVPRFQPVGDFGSGFYCADKVRTALRFAILTALAAGEGRQSSSLMYFDVDDDDLSQLNQMYVGGDEWSEWTAECLSDQEDTVYKEERDGLQLVIGKLVHNPHEVELDGEPSQAFEDSRLQYCFRKETGNLLLKDKTKMGVALFDVCLPPEEGGDNESTVGEGEYNQ